MSNQAPKDRIASAPSLEDAQTYGSACCNSTSTEHHPNCPVRSVEACDQPKDEWIEYCEKESKEDSNG